MILIGIDPSITATGLVVLNMDSLEAYEARVIKPIPQRGHWSARVSSIIKQMVKAASVLPPDTRIIMEDLTNHVHRKRHGGGGAGLATYGAVIGSIRTRFLSRIELLDQSAWNTAIWSTKAARCRRVLAEFPELADALAADKGHDISDAAAVALRWHQLEHERSIT